jgi:6-phosphogluconolactonase (cycloisomerase 2 family)
MSNYAYVTSKFYTGSAYISSLSMYSIDTHGELNPLIPGTVPLDQTYIVTDITTIDMNGNYYAYITIIRGSAGSNYYIFMYSIDKHTGQLKPLDPSKIESGFDNKMITVKISGRYYVYAMNNTSIDMYSVQENGQLHSLGTTSPIGNLSSNTNITTINRNGIYYVYVINSDKNIYMYSIQDTGILSLLDPSMVAIGSFPTDITTVDIHGSWYAYVTNFDNSISRYSIETNGELTPLDPSIATGSQPVAITTVNIKSDYYAYVVNQDDGIISGSVSMYSIQTDGRLIPLDPSMVSTGVKPYTITTHNIDGYQYAYVTNQIDNSISEYSIEANGQLTPLGTVPTKQNPQNITTLTIPSSPTPISNICFPANTPIVTDQGIFPIQHIHPTSHTIGTKKIVAITQSISTDNYLVCFEKNALGTHCPSERTIMSQEHKVLYRGKMREAWKFVARFEQVKKVPYHGEMLYNVLLEQHGTIQVNHMLCETLHPENFIARLYRSSMSEKDRNHQIVVMNDSIQQKDHVSYKKIVKQF